MVFPESSVTQFGRVLPGRAVGRQTSSLALAPRHPLARLVHKQDFERMLTTAPRLRSTHFAVHHLPDGPTGPVRPCRGAAAPKLSTDDAKQHVVAVDEMPAPPPSLSASDHWLGIVIPKRHARRSVTRSLLKRQIRSAMALHVDALLPGMWLVRLRAPYPSAQFPSAASHALRGAAQRELEQLLAGTAR